MKKLLSILLAVALIVSAVPAFVFESSAASGSLPLDLDVSVSTSAGEWVVNTFRPTETGIYIFSSSGSLDTLGYIALEEGEAENQNIKDDGGQGDNFAVTYNMRAGVTYYLGSTLLTGSGSYSVKIIKFEIEDHTITPITASTNTQVSLKQANGTKFFSFVPSASGKFVYCSSGNFDTFGYIFDDTWSQIAYDDDGGSVQNFEITLDLQAGKTYYFGCSTASVSTANFNILIYQKNRIRSVSVDTPPNKTTYYKGLDAMPVSGGKYHVNLALFGFKFSVNYTNGSSEIRKYTYSVRGVDCETSCDLNSGANDVGFAYMGYSSSLSINVEDPPVSKITITQLPTKTVYYDDDITISEDVEHTRIFNILLTGMMIHVENTDGTQDTFRINSAYGEEIDYLFFDHVIKADDMQLGTNTFKISYFGKEAEFEVNYSLISGNWQYEVVDNSYICLTQYKGTDVNVNIPESLDGYPVKAIGEKCFYENRSITSVNMTERITAIGSEAFYNCRELTELTLPSSLTSVGDKAFYGLRKLNKLNWNAPALTFTSNDMFGNMGVDTENGTAVEFGMSCTAIPDQAFNLMSSTSYAPKIYKIIIGENVSTIGNSAFRDLSALKKVEYNAINASVKAANNIWTSSGNPSFEVEIGEYVEVLPSNLFYSSSQKWAPKMSKVTFLGKNTVLNSNCIRNNSAVDNTYYVWYNPELQNSAYNYVTAANYDFELLDPKLESIYLYAGSFKNEFVIDDEFSLGTADVRAVYDNGTEKSVNSFLSVSGFDNTTTGTQTLTLSYTSELTTKTLTYQISMRDKPLVLDYIELVSAPDKTEYIQGEELSLEGMEINAVFTVGTSQPISENIVLGEYDMTALGEQNISVFYTYEGVTRQTEFTINIEAPSPTKLRLMVPEDNTDYIAGSSFRRAGITVIAEYNDGSETDVSDYVNFSGYDMSALGEQQVTVSFTDNGKTVTENFGIFVHNYLTKIVLVALPSVRTYVVGSEFNPAGIRVTALREDNKGEDVSDAVTYSGYNMNEPGTQTVTVTYSENGVSKSADFEITLRAATLTSIEIASEPTETQYQNTPFNLQGFKLTAHYSDNSSRDVTALAELSGYDMNSYGEQLIYVNYSEGEVSLRTTFKINVIRQVPSELNITELPDKTIFEVGGDFSAAGIEAQLVYNNALTATLGADDLSFTGYNMSASGKQSVIVSYTEGTKTVSTSYEIELFNREVSVSITSQPTKTRYYIGEELDLSGLVVSATMANGNSTVITHDKLSISGFDNQTEGVQSISVCYTSPITDVTYNMSFDITVVSGLQSIAITSQPSKTVFYYSDELDTTGLVVTAYYVDNTSKPVTDKCVLSGYNMNSVGRQSVSVSYTEGSVSKTAAFNINVKDYATSIYISNMPSKLSYNLGENLSTASLAVKARFAVGADRAITSSVTNSGFESETPGVKTVNISYNTDKGVLQTSFNVSVYDAIKSLEMTSSLEKTLYSLGEDIDTSSLTAQAELSTGQIIDIPYSDLSISGYNPNQKGRQFISVKYNYDSSQTTQPLTVFVEYDDSCDVNGDLFVDLSDISAILISGNYSLPVPQAQNARCDVNADGNIDIFDISEILNKDNYAKAIG